MEQKKNKLLDLATRTKKEHFIKLILWTVGISLTLIWLAMLIAASISAGPREILSSTKTLFSIEDIGSYIANASLYSQNDITLNFDENGVIKGFEVWRVIKKIDWNPLCLTYSPELTGWFLLVVLAPAGYLGIIFIIAYMKNLITPQQVKKTNRKALMFGYLKQKDVEYICNEIDYNVGIKQRPKTLEDYILVQDTFDIKVHEREGNNGKQQSKTTIF